MVLGDILAPVLVFMVTFTVILFSGLAAADSRRQLLSISGGAATIVTLFYLDIKHGLILQKLIERLELLWNIPL